MAIWGGLTNSCAKKRGEKQRRKGKIKSSGCRVPKRARRDKKAFFSDQCKEIDLADTVPNELWMEVRDTVQETGIKIIPIEKKCKNQNGCLGRPYK